MHPSDRQPRREIMTAPVVHIHEMMARLGIGPETAVLPGLSLRYATAVRRCKLCRSKTSCRDWLDYAPALVNFAPGFCVNAEILFELQYDQPGPRRIDSNVKSLADSFGNGAADGEKS
jgi:hypothetical protein